MVGAIVKMSRDRVGSQLNNINNITPPRGSRGRPGEYGTMSARFAFVPNSPTRYRASAQEPERREETCPADSSARRKK